MNLARIRCFIINEVVIHPEMMKDFRAWPKLDEFVELLDSMNLTAIVTNQISGKNSMREDCRIVYLNRSIHDTDGFVLLGFCPIVDHGITCS